MTPDDLQISVQHCGQELEWRGSGVRWEGIVEHSQKRLRCKNCGLKVTVLVEDLSPLPEGAGS